MKIGERPDAATTEPADAVVRVVRVCGSDLWYCRGIKVHEVGRLSASSGPS